MFASAFLQCDPLSIRAKAAHDQVTCQAVRETSGTPPASVRRSSVDGTRANQLSSATVKSAQAPACGSYSGRLNCKTELLTALPDTVPYLLDLPQMLWTAQRPYHLLSTVKQTGGVSLAPLKIIKVLHLQRTGVLAAA